MNKRHFVFILLIAVLAASCQKDEELLEVPSNTTQPLIERADAINFAVIGDFGKEGDNALAVSELVKSWNPDYNR